MRKLKLEMHISLSGWDDQVMNFTIENLKNVDCILLGRKTAKDFIPHWAGVANNPKAADYKIGKLLTDIPKVVFSNKLKANKWDNTTIVKGDITEQIKILKKKKGKDIIVYGGYSFVSSLIQHGLIDEYYILLNPLSVNSEHPIVKELKNDLRLTLIKCKSFECGTVLLCYNPKNSNN